MTVKAKPILDGKFWIVEDEGIRVGTLSISDDKFMLSHQTQGISFYDTKRQLEKKLGASLFEVKATILPKEEDNEVHGFPTSCQPHNPLYDVKRKLPLFTKSEKSKSLYCAGYYVIRFDKGWVKSFCPKLITIERYESNGPFKTELEMRQELSRVNAK